VRSQSRYQNQPQPQNSTPATPGNQRRQPAHEIRFGLIKAAIWENQSQNGTWHSVTLSRSYKDGEEWRHTDSFGREDLLAVAKAADLAHSWICDHRQPTANAPG